MFRIAVVCRYSRSLTLSASVAQTTRTGIMLLLADMKIGPRNNGGRSCGTWSLRSASRIMCSIVLPYVLFWFSFSFFLILFLFLSIFLLHPFPRVWFLYTCISATLYFFSLKSFIVFVDCFWPLRCLELLFIFVEHSQAQTDTVKCMLIERTNEGRRAKKGKDAMKREEERNDVAILIASRRLLFRSA